MDRLASWVAFLKEGVENEFDFFLTIDGPEGAGKSTLAMHIKALYDGAYNLEHVLFDSQDLIDQLENAPMRSCIILDEAITSFFNRTALDRFQIRLVQALSIVRARELVFMLLLPNYFVLDPALRVRSKYRFWVYPRRFERGFVKVYYSKRNEWTTSNPWLEHRWSYIFPKLPEKVGEMYRVFKFREMNRVLRKYQAEADAEETRKTTDARKVKGTKMRMVLDALRKDPGRDVEDVSLDVGCTVGYVQEIRRTLVKAGTKGDGQTH